MKPSPDNPEHRWSELVRRARADTPPRLDVESLLARLQDARPDPVANWLADLVALLETRRCVATCAIAAITLAAFGSWQAVTWVEALAWIEWAYPAAGGMS